MADLFTKMAHNFQTWVDFYERRTSFNSYKSVYLSIGLVSQFFALLVTKVSLFPCWPTRLFNEALDFF